MRRCRTGVYAACAELGLSIPGDIAVAGFGDHPISRLLAPPLTSTMWDIERVAELGTGSCSRRSRPKAPRKRCASSSPVLVARESTDRVHVIYLSLR
jgi:DNA-binding LacI/PurR family transcriptional regulator